MGHPFSLFSLCVNTLNRFSAGMAIRGSLVGFSNLGYPVFCLLPIFENLSTEPRAQSQEKPAKIIVAQ
jgi:hypothetical protein